MRKMADALSCTVKELKTIITAPPGGVVRFPPRGQDEVYPRLWIGNEASARNLDELQRLGITHILNGAKGTKFGHVNTSGDMYTSIGIEFMAINATDVIGFKLKTFFTQTSDFIEHGLDAGEIANKNSKLRNRFLNYLVNDTKPLYIGKVMVHCREGFSRSATLVLAFLMQKRHLTAQEAMRQIRSCREICPNDGFLKQLCELNEDLLNTYHK